MIQQFLFGIFFLKRQQSIGRRMQTALKRLFFKQYSIHAAALLDKIVLLHVCHEIWPLFVPVTLEENKN